jgi:hypothetical protein
MNKKSGLFSGTAKGELMLGATLNAFVSRLIRCIFQVRRKT